MKKKTDTPNDVLRPRILDRFGSISQFAIRTGIDRAQIYPILRGDALPGLRNAVAMAMALGYTLDGLVEILDPAPRDQTKTQDPAPKRKAKR